MIFDVVVAELAYLGRCRGQCNDLDMTLHFGEVQGKEKVTHLVAAWAWPEIFVGKVKLFNTERTKGQSISLKSSS